MAVGIVMPDEREKPTVDESTLAYLRVSTGGQTFKQQEAILKNAFPEWWQTAEVIRETASGANSKRPLWQGVLGRIRRGEVTRLLVSDLTRGTRSLSDLYAWVELCDRVKCDIECAKMPIPKDKLARMATISAWGLAAEMERMFLRERRSEALNRKTVEEGWQVGGSPKGWFSAKVVKRAPNIFAQLDAGLSINSIAKATKTDHRVIKRLIQARDEGLLLRSAVDGEVQYRNGPREDAYLVDY